MRYVFAIYFCLSGLVFAEKAQEPCDIQLSVHQKCKISPNFLTTMSTFSEKPKEKPSEIEAKDKNDTTSQGQD